MPDEQTDANTETFAASESAETLSPDEEAMIPEGDGDPSSDEPDHSDTGDDDSAAEVGFGVIAMCEIDGCDKPAHPEHDDGLPLCNDHWIQQDEEARAISALDPEEAGRKDAEWKYQASIEPEYLTLVGRIQPANRRAEGAGFATHLHCSVESIKDGKMIDIQDAQERIVDREEGIRVPIKVHPDADEISITITSVREDDDMETLELARHLRVKIEDLRRGPMKMPLFHQSMAVTIPPPTTLIIEDLCAPDGASLIAERETPSVDEPSRPIYRIDDPVATNRGVGRITEFKDGDIVVVMIVDAEVEFSADEIQPYHMTGGG